MNVRSGPWMLRRYLTNRRIHELVLSSTRLDMGYDVNAYVTSLLLRVHVTVSGKSIGLSVKAELLGRLLCS